MRDRNDQLYKTWEKMRERCQNIKHVAYDKYGGRGIRVCPEWNESFRKFKDDMGERPEGKTLDRIDNNLGYYKENCRWATRAEQNRNKSTTIKIEINGRSQCLTDWCKETGVDRFVAYRRIECGWHPVDAVLTPGRSATRLDRSIRVMVDSVCREIGEWAMDLGVSRNTVWMRIQAGWPLEVAVTAAKGTKLHQYEGLALT